LPLDEQTLKRRKVDSLDEESGHGNGNARKQTFTTAQTSILKKWFILHADYPYLKEEDRKELS
jgi:hypothetical protein